MVRLPKAELIQEERDLLHLLAGGREDVGVAALLQPEQHGRELDQLAGRPEDDEDHAFSVLASRWRASTARARHTPTPCATAYTGDSAANEAVSNTGRLARNTTTTPPPTETATMTGRKSGRRKTRRARAALSG